MIVNIDGTPVRKAVVVRAPVEDAFEVFTSDIDSWWPRTHHIGKSPMRQVIMEGRAGGRCYTEQVDGTECDWGRVLVWEPPHRLVLAWQITHEWGYQPDLSRCSEVEARFVRLSGDATRVELEHRHFERHDPGGDAMRAVVDGPNGWATVLALFERRVNASNTPTT